MLRLFCASATATTTSMGKVGLGMNLRGWRLNLPETKQ